MYKGEFKNGFKNGQGVLTSPNGKKYEGDFKDDMKHGKGVLIYKDGKHYTGDFKNGWIGHTPLSKWYSQNWSI